MGFLLLNEVPDLGTLIGGTIIIFSVILFSLKGK
jgi:drug/metabolite transporter (DMT)-like permease